jgi:ABC-type transport system involved in multi-copper enzyme maturation permease subunit
VSGFFNIARWEWFRLVRRKMPWILLAIFLAFTQLAVWGTYVTYQTIGTGTARVPVPPGGGGMGMPNLASCSELLANPAAVVPAGTPQPAIERMQRQCEQRVAAIAARYVTLSPTGAVSSALGIAASLGLILFGILSASTVGMDYGLGTLRPILARGTGRMPFLAGKYLMLIGTTLSALVLICAAAAGSGLLAAAIAPPPPPGALAAPTMGAIGITFAKTLGGMVTYVTLASAVTLLVRSTAAGMAISLAWYVAEGILIRLMSAVFESFDKIADYLPMRNIGALANERGGLAAMLGGGNDIGTLHASLVLAGWTILFAGVAAVVFQR